MTVTSTQLTGGQWIGAAVRLQSSGLNGYVGMYFWNSGSPQLRLYKRSGGSWTQLGGSYSSGPLAAGTQLEVTAVGSTISFLAGGVQRLTVTDGSFTGGAPGIMAYGNGYAGQLVRRERRERVGRLVHGGRDRVRAVRDGGAAGQWRG